MATSAYEAIANPDEPHVQNLAPWAVKRRFVLAVVGAMGVLCGLVFWSGVSPAPEPNGINGPQGHLQKLLLQLDLPYPETTLSEITICNYVGQVCWHVESSFQVPAWANQLS